MRLRLRAACKFTEKQASTQVFSCKFLRNFHEKLFCRTPPGHCFLMLHLISGIINKTKNKRRSGYFRYHPVFFCIFDNFYCRDCKRAKFSTNWKGQTGILKFVTRAFSYSVPNQTMQNLWNTSLKTSTYDKLLRTLMIPMNDLISKVQCDTALLDNFLLAFSLKAYTPFQYRKAFGLGRTIGTGKLDGLRVACLYDFSSQKLVDFSLSGFLHKSNN